MIVHFMEIGSFLATTVSIYDLFQAAAFICPVLTGNHSDSKSDLGTMDERNLENRTPLTTPINLIYLKLRHMSALVC